MKTIGLIGGTSWVSTLDYYRIINSTVNQRKGGNEAAKIILHSVNYGEIVGLTMKDDWDSITKIICTEAINLEKSGADCLLLCANTMHKIAGEVQSAVSVPLLHIASVTARAIRQKGIDRILLLGTRFTMTGGFYEDSLRQEGIETIIPDEQGRKFVHDTIYNELGKDIFLPATKRAYLDIIQESAGRGARGVILGCTEIPLLLKGEDPPLPFFDTASLHALAAVDFALSE